MKLKTAEKFALYIYIYIYNMYICNVCIQYIYIELEIIFVCFVCNMHQVVSEQTAGNLWITVVLAGRKL